MNMPYAYVYAWCERVKDNKIKEKDKRKDRKRKEINRVILVVP